MFPGEQISHVDTLSRLRFKDETPKEEKTCFFQNATLFADTQTIKLKDIKNDIQSNWTHHPVFERIWSDDWRPCSIAESHFKKDAETLTRREGIIYRGVVIALRRVAWWPGRSQDVVRLFSRFEFSQKVGLPLRKTFSKWPEAVLSKQFLMEWAQVKE